MPSISPILSASQIETLAGLGEERTAAAGEVLYEVGDERYPFIAILEGEAAILDTAGDEIVRHGASGFLGELNLMTGQTVYLTAVATQPMRYIAVEREVLRPLLFEDGPLGDLLLSAFIARREALQTHQGIGVEIIGPRSSAATRTLAEYLRRARTPYTWRDPEHDDDPALARLAASVAPEELPLVRLPGGTELRRPSAGEVWRALGIGTALGAREEVDLVVVGAGPAGLGAAVYGASEGLSTLIVESTVLGGQAGVSRRIENYLGFPAGISGTELTTRAVTQARKFGARMATPYRAVALEPGPDRHIVRLDGGEEIAARAVVLATGADYRRLPVDDLEDYEGVSVFYAAGPPEAQRCGATRVAVIGGGNSAAQAAIWLSRGGALVTLLHRRADLQRDDVRLPDRRPRAPRRRGPRPLRDRRAARDRRPARGGHAARRRAARVLLPVPVPRRVAVHRLARRRRPARRARLRPHRRRRRRRRSARELRAGRLRRRRRALGLAQALRHGGRRGRGGRAPRARPAEHRAGLIRRVSRPGSRPARSSAAAR